MKKLLSLMMLLVAIAMGANAADITIATKSGSSGTGTWSANSGSVTGTVALPNELGNISFSLPKTGSNSNAISSNYLTWKSGETLTITMPTGVTISAIELTCTAQDKGPANSSKHEGVVADNISCSLGTVSAVGESTTVFSASGTAANSITVSNTMGGEFRVTQIVLTYAAGPVKDYTVTAASNNSSYGTASSVASSLDEGETTEITASPKAGYEFTSWSVSGEGAKLSSNTTNPTTLTMGTADATVTATFSAINYTITHGDATGGTYTISVAGGEATSSNTTATVGQTVTLSGTPSVAILTDISWNVKDADNKDITVTDGSFTMPASNVTITPEFSKPSLVKVVFGGKTSATKSGTIDCTPDVNLSSANKMDKSKYAGFTLAGENTFQAGDVINVNIKTAAGDVDGKTGTIIFYDSNNGANILMETGVVGVVGDNKFVVNSNIVGQKTIYLYRSNDNTVNPWNATLNYIEVIRPESTITLNANGYATYSNASDFEFAGAKAYKMNLNFTGGTLEGTEVTGKIKAGEGILFKGTAGATVAIAETIGASALADNSLVGTTPATGDAPTPDYTSYKYFVLKGKSFVPYTTATTFGAGKAFFQVAKDAQLPASLELVFDGEEATAVDAVAEAKAEAAAPVKVIKNGKLYIGNYNVAGQQVK